jgi:hypothetical protein
MIEELSMWHAHNLVVLSKLNLRRKGWYDISNMAMMEEYSMWCAHNLVVLSKTNRRRKGCVYLKCGHDRGVCNVTCSWSCSTKRIESTKEWMMLWSPMWVLRRSMQCGVLINLVVLSETNRRRKRCVDLECGHDRGVCNVTSSSSRSTKWVVSSKDGMMCWFPIWAW